MSPPPEWVACVEVSNKENGAGELGKKNFDISGGVIPEVGSGLEIQKWRS